MVDWDDLLRHEGPAVWRTAYRLLRNRADADECYQETFLAALKVSSRQPVRNWPAMLQRLATSRSIDRLRKRMRRRERADVLDPAVVPPIDGDPSQRANAEELDRQLRWAIGQLPAKQAEVFCLHQLGDWSNQQIADQLGITANSVGVILHRTRQKLQELLKLQNRLSAVVNHVRPK